MKKLFGLTIFAALLLSGCNFGPATDPSGSSNPSGDYGDSSIPEGSGSGDSSSTSEGGETLSWPEDIATIMEETLSVLMPVYPLSNNLDLQDDRGGDYGYGIFDLSPSMTQEDYAAKFNTNKPAGWTSATYDSEDKWYFAESDDGLSWFGFYEETYEGEKYFGIQFDSENYVPESDIEYLTDWTDAQKALMNRELLEVLPFMENAFSTETEVYFENDYLYVVTELDYDYFDEDAVEPTCVEDYLDVLEGSGFDIDGDETNGYYGYKASTRKITLGNVDYDGFLNVVPYITYSFTEDWDLVFLFVLQAAIEMDYQVATAFPATEFNAFLEDVPFGVETTALAAIFDSNAGFMWQYAAGKFLVLGSGATGGFNTILALLEALAANAYIISIESEKSATPEEGEGEEPEAQGLVLRDPEDSSESSESSEGGEEGGEEQEALMYSVTFADYKGDYQGEIVYDELTNQLALTVAYYEAPEGYTYSETFPAEQLKTYGIENIPGFDVGESVYKYYYTANGEKYDDGTACFEVSTYIGGDELASSYATFLEEKTGVAPVYDANNDEYTLTLSELGEKVFFYDYEGYFVADYIKFEPVVPTFGFDFTTDLSSYVKSRTTEQLVMEKDGVRITVSKGTGELSVVQDNTSYISGTKNGLRVYTGHEMTITATEGEIASIAMTLISGNASDITVTGGTGAMVDGEYIITPSGSEVKLTFAAQVRVGSLVATFAE